MTTRGRVIRHERASDWPIFDGRAIARDIDILAVELNRRSGEKIESVVAAASGMLRLALARAMPLAQYRFWLIAWGQAIDPSNKVATYHAERNRLWAAIEKSGGVVPEGARSETRVDYGDGTFGFAGTVDFAVGELPLAVELTRRHNAACLALDALVVDPIARARSLPFPPEDGGATMLVRAITGEFGESMFVARGFGQFDDVTVGVEVLAKSDFISTLEPHFAAIESH
jgi:hypothetical protein